MCVHMFMYEPVQRHIWSCKHMSRDWGWLWVASLIMLLISWATVSYWTRSSQSGLDWLLGSPTDRPVSTSPALGYSVSTSPALAYRCLPPSVLSSTFCIFKDFFIFMYLDAFAGCMYVCICTMCGWYPWRSAEGTGSPWTGVTHVVSCHARVGTEPRSSGRTASVLNHWVISPHPV